MMILLEPSVTSSTMAEKMQEAQRTVENLQKAIVQVSSYGYDG